MTQKTQLTPGFIRWMFHDVIYIENLGLDPAPVWSLMSETRWFEARMKADDIIHEYHEALEP